jgi:hypothetical protein
MANHVDTDWAESRLDRQNSASAHGWSELTEFDDTKTLRRDRLRRRRQQRNALWLGIAGLATLIAATVSVGHLR